MVKVIQYGLLGANLQQLWQITNKTLLLLLYLLSLLTASEALVAAPIKAITNEQLEQEQKKLQQAKPVYIDRLIDENVAEDAVPEMLSAPELEPDLQEPQGLRSIELDIGLLRQETYQGRSYDQQDIRLDAFMETLDYGDFRLEMQLSNDSGYSFKEDSDVQASITLKQYNYLLNKDWSMDNAAGIVKNFHNRHIRQSGKLSLPSHNYAGIVTRLNNDNSKTEVRLMAGEKGEFSGYHDFKTKQQLVFGAGILRVFNEQWLGGGQIWRAEGDDRTHNEITLSAEHVNENKNVRSKVQVVGNQSAGGAWFDNEYIHSRYHHQSGIYLLGDGLTWMGEDIPDNSLGAYWRMSFSHPRFTTHSSIDWKKLGANPGAGYNQDSRYLNLSQSLSFQYDRQTRLGGRISHYQTEGENESTRSRASIFLSRHWSSGQHARLQLGILHDSDYDADGYKGLGRELDYTHYLLLPGNNELSWQLNLKNEPNEIEDRQTRQAGLEWRHSLEDGGSFGASWSMSRYDHADDTNSQYNYRIFLHKKINKQLGITLDAQQSYNEEDERDRQIGLSLSWKTDWGKPLDKRNRRSGIIRGVVFLDNNSDGRLQTLDKKAANILVVLNGQQSTRTDHNGEFEFRYVPSGTNRLEIALESIPLPWEVPVNFDGRVEVELRTTTKVEIPLIKIQE